MWAPLTMLLKQTRVKEKEPRKLEPEADEAQQDIENEKKKDCRDNCMHCGAHCIYLKKYREEEE